MVYKWKCDYYSVDANVVGKALEEIEEENGEITARLVVDKATPEDSALHSLFTWDDEKAADEWRLHEARRVIAAVAVVYEEDNTTENKSIRAFANVGARNKAAFVTMAKALSDDESREIVLKHAIEELQAFKSKYAGLIELAEVFKSIEKITV